MLANRIRLLLATSFEVDEVQVKLQIGGDAEALDLLHTVVDAIIFGLKDPEICAGRDCLQLERLGYVFLSTGKIEGCEIVADEWSDLARAREHRQSVRNTVGDDLTQLALQFRRCESRIELFNPIVIVPVRARPLVQKFARLAQFAAAALGCEFEFDQFLFEFGNQANTDVGFAGKVLDLPALAGIRQEYAKYSCAARSEY